MSPSAAGRARDLSRSGTGLVDLAQVDAIVPREPYAGDQPVFIAINGRPARRGSLLYGERH
jgi:hypothetical protein